MQRCAPEGVTDQCGAAESKSETQAGDERTPRVRDLVAEIQVQGGELRKLGNELQPRVRDLVTATQVQAVELREFLANVLQPRVRDLDIVIQVQAGQIV